jgi:hypothetical protein
MDSDNRRSRGMSWSLVLTAVVFFAPLLYVVCSGPMRTVFDKVGATEETHDRIFAPLVWLRDNTPASDAIDWYWELFPTGNTKLNVNRGEYHDEYDAVAKEGRGETDFDPMGDWLYSPEARAINRHLGVSE